MRVDLVVQTYVTYGRLAIGKRGANCVLRDKATAEAPCRTAHVSPEEKETHS